MGCDITMFVEKRNEEYNYWEPIFLYHVNKYTHQLEKVRCYSSRDYDIFSLLAGVRGWYDPFVSPRGCHQDMSAEVEKEKEWFGIDGHSHTWYDLFELKLFIAHFKETNENEEDIFQRLDSLYNSIGAYLDFSDEYLYNLKPNQYRVIMWFDS